MVVRLALMLAVLGQAGCQIGCTEMGCIGEVRFTFDPATFDAADVGLYELHAQVDDFNVWCDGTVAEGFECSEFWSVREDPRSGPVELVGYWGQRIDTVTLTVERDGVVVFDQAFDADGEPVFPNGRRCGGACESFSAQVGW